MPQMHQPFPNDAPFGARKGIGGEFCPLGIIGYRRALQPSQSVLVDELVLLAYLPSSPPQTLIQFG